MTSRGLLLQAAESGSGEELLGLLGQNVTIPASIDVDEVISSMDKKQLDQLWSGLQTICTSALLEMGDGEEEEEEQREASQKRTTLLHHILTMAMATVKTHADAPQSLFETAVILHGVLLSLPESADKLKNAIAKFCEIWWNEDLEGKEDLTPQTIMYLLQRTLQSKPLVADIKRVWNLHLCLQHMDLQNESSETLKTLLQQCMMQSAYLKLKEGRLFLSFLFSLNCNFIECLHRTVKNQLPYCSKSVLQWYGDIYFRAWRVAAGPFLEKIELYCIQDLMYHAVHAPRGSTHSLASSLRKVLEYFHQQKKQKGVDEMLLRLYEPILWRSLKVANGNVRANAAALMIDAFPLQNPEDNVEEIDRLMQKQFDMLQTLLEDPCPVVRATTIHGVCRICCTFWELIPSQTIAGLVQSLVQDLAWDAASSDVRVAVLKGLTFLLDNHLSHPLFKTVLPGLSNLLHDTSEKVRVAFMEMLLKVKGMRAIKFWTIVPMEHLLARLEIDTPPIVKRIVTLIFNSYMPVEKGMEVQVARCHNLIQANAGAARRFYQYAHCHMDLEHTVKFIMYLCRCVSECVRKHRVSDSGVEMSNRLDEEEDEEEKENELETELTLNDTEVMSGLLETMVVLWGGVSAQLDKPANAELKEKLHAKFSKCLPDFFRVMHDNRCYDALVFLAGFLPASSIPTISRSCLSKIKSLEESSAEPDYGTLLESMCSWGKVKDILALVSEWIYTGLRGETADAQNSSASKARRKAKSVTFCEPGVPKPLLAVAYLGYLTKHALCREALLNQGRRELTELTAELADVLKLIEERLGSSEALGTHTSDKFLVEAFTLYCKLEVLLHNPDNADHNAVTVVEHLLSWADTELLPSLNQTTVESTAEEQDRHSKKRTVSDSQAPALTEMTQTLIETLLTIASNMLLVGVCDREFISRLVEIGTGLLHTERSTFFLPLICKLLYQITEHFQSQEEEEEGAGSREPDEGLGQGTTDLVPVLLSTLVQTFAKLVHHDKTAAEKVLPRIRQPLTEVLKSFHRQRPGRADVSRDVMATIMAAVLAEVTNTIKQEQEVSEYEGLHQLPMLSAFLLTAVNKKSGMVRIFLEELYHCLDSEAIQDIFGLASALQILAVFSRIKPGEDGLKNSITALQVQLQRLPVLEEEGESPERHLYNSSKTVLKSCMQQAGMVA
ncbi:condensin-2 complex subunit G2-like [Lingula anatina]|uniref:Condensin-2 complex subunit G2-like n=1 Tax=Lingula anatina TaxID=7574 RepID=A0A1S3H1D8_LINAN|nr:condensin-2 complex subunit G2-like [Lingula anatina]|eukprot:XP_013379950.1 condensin-2 complex subunit G2-like [Lingula anatina]